MSIGQSREMLLETSIPLQIDSLDWTRITQELDENGYATTGRLLSIEDCNGLADGYDTASQFRSRVIMSRHGFGRGEYQYYSYPLPAVIQTLREALYPRLAGIANKWNAALHIAQTFPAEHAEFLRVCHEAGQQRPTPLLLRYQPGDYNCLHQDLYGDIFFPLQVAFLLCEPERDFTGGEFVLTEQRPRMQSRVSGVPLRQGEAVIFAVNHRPQRGSRGVYRVAMRHGVSPVRSGQRHTLGVIFHDAR